MTTEVASTAPARDALTAPLAPSAPARLRARGLSSYLTAIAISALWGASFVLTKGALGYIGPMGIAFMRWSISALLLVGWIAARGRLPVARRLVRDDWRSLIWLALSGVTLFYALENVAVGYTTATNAGILSNMTTVFMVLMAVVWFHERLAPLEWFALALSLVGAVLVSQGSGHVDLSGQGLRGDVLMVLATVFAAAYSVSSKRVTARYPADVVTAMIATLGALMLLPLVLREGLNLATLPPFVWGSLLLLGVGSGALANLWWLHLLSYMDAARASMFLLLVPVFSTLLGVAILHEPLPAMALFGGILVLAGVFMTRGRA